ncbi:hypothetical protein [Metabacillus litoralis]|uniref:hypothetical protein n=2 Tax=Metabacillus litoralis TaxID=152268 RepID=UPI00203D53C9|nr:hypothetical protein [Metabacillus litoralis]MCM3162601.1 hypothetical protein [Metabacillus litoralis]
MFSKKALLTFICAFIFIFIGTNESFAASTTANVKKQGDILQGKLTTFNKVINSGDIHHIDSLYDDLSKQIKTTETAVGKVSGKKNRDALLAKYVVNAKIARERVIYEVSQYRLLGKINEQISQQQYTQAESNLAKLSRLKKRAVEIKKTGGYQAVPTAITSTLNNWESSLSSQLHENNEGLKELWQLHFKGEPLFETNVQDDGSLLYGNYNIVNEVYHADIMSLDESGKTNSTWSIKEEQVDRGGTEANPKVLTIKYSEGILSSYSMDGDLEWTYSLKQPLDKYEHDYDVAQNGTIYVYLDNEIQAISSQGKLLYSIPKPTAEYDIEYANDGSVYVLDIQTNQWKESSFIKYTNTGQEAWRQSLAVDREDINAIYYYDIVKVEKNAYVYIGYDAAEYFDSLRTLYSFDAAGNLNWSNDSFGYIYENGLKEYNNETLILSDTDFYVLDSSGNIKKQTEIIAQNSYGYNMDDIYEYFFISNGKLIFNTNEFLATMAPNGTYSWKTDIADSQWYSSLYPMDEIVVLTYHEENKTHLYSNAGQSLGSYSFGINGWVQLSGSNASTNSLYFLQTTYDEGKDEYQTTLHALKY